MENSGNLNNQINESNNVGEEKKNNNKTIGLVILAIGLLLVGVAVYKLFIEKPETDKPKPAPTVTPTPTPEPSSTTTSSISPSSDNLITELTKSELSDSNKEFKFANTSVKLKKVDDKLYINDTIATIQDYSGEFVEIEPSTIYKTNKYIIISVEWQSTAYPYAINENGELINVKRLTDDTGQECIHDIKLENGKIIALQSVDEPGVTDKKVEFVYEVDKMTIKYVE